MLSKRQKEELKKWEVPPDQRLETLKQFMDKWDLTPIVVADICGVHRVTVHRWLNGINGKPPKTIHKSFICCIQIADACYSSVLEQQRIRRFS